jgi:replicative superfamily II helicase
LTRLADNVNAEVAIGTISTVADAIGYLDWTFFSRRVKVNPSYYGASSGNAEDIKNFFSRTIKDSLHNLYREGCIIVDAADFAEVEAHTTITSSVLGRTASNFYLCYKTPIQMRKSILSLRDNVLPLMKQELSKFKSESNDRSKESYLPTDVEASMVSSIFYHLAHTHEFDELPVRHNEEHLNYDLSKKLLWGYEVAYNQGRTKMLDKESILDVMKDPHTK